MPKEEEEKKKDEIDRHIQVVNTITSFWNVTPCC
jgi:hypothetical protein